jgi:hypothetical protein
MYKNLISILKIEMYIKVYLNFIIVVVQIFYNISIYPIILNILHITFNTRVIFVRQTFIVKILYFQVFI